MTERDSVTVLRKLVDLLPGRLSAFLPDEVEKRRDSDGLSWSRKEELGHLIDSASHNHQRFVRGQLLESPELPNYEGADWVSLLRYQDRSWSELIELWSALNRVLLFGVEAVPDEAWERTCRIGEGNLVTLGFVMDDYIDHMAHHLRHIGVDFDDLTGWSRYGNE